MGKTKRFTKKELNEIFDYYNSGKTRSEVCKKFGFSVIVIDRLRRENKNLVSECGTIIRRKNHFRKTKETKRERIKKGIIKPYNNLKRWRDRNGSWNKGLTKEDPRVLKNISGGSRRTQFKKRRKSPIKGKTWEEFYGKEKAEEIKQKMKKSKKGKSSWNKGVKGYHVHDQEFKDNLSKRWKGIKRSKEYKENISKKNTGKVRNLKVRQKYSAIKQGIPFSEWKRFSAFEPYDEKWTNRFKKAIRKRDNQICMLCGIHREKLNKALAVHHINYNKKMTLPENCVALCNKCHVNTNFNRKHWTNFFQSLLSEKYDYQYENNQPVLNVEVVR